MDAYDTIMVRLRYDTKVTRDCKVEVDGTTYRIQSFHADQRQGTIQITAVEEIAG
jgi:SPP1 family predicted phage head-tail adaptor